MFNHQTCKQYNYIFGVKHERGQKLDGEARSADAGTFA
jgi:hypothetical protein